MRTILASVLVVLSIAAPRALAGDVAYQLETSALVPYEKTKESQSLTLTIKDREWAMPGKRSTNHGTGRGHPRRGNRNQADQDAA